MLDGPREPDLSLGEERFSCPKCFAIFRAYNDPARGVEPPPSKIELPGHFVRRFLQNLKALAAPGQDQGPIKKVLGEIANHSERRWLFRIPEVYKMGHGVFQHKITLIEPTFFWIVHDRNMGWIAKSTEPELHPLTGKLRDQAEPHLRGNSGIVVPIDGDRHQLARNVALLCPGTRSKVLTRHGALLCLTPPPCRELKNWHDVGALLAGLDLVVPPIPEL